MQPGHGPIFDRAPKPAAHDKLRTIPKLLHKRSQLAKVVSEIRVAHHDPFSSDERYCINIGAPQTARRRAQDFCAMRKSDLGRLIGRAVDNQYLAAHLRRGETLFTPIDEFSDR